jgi:site-specific DNA-cytosine methylase
LENVAALVSQKFLPLFNKWQAELASYGYSNFAEVLNAKDYGVPQNRERVFLVSILGGGSYHFPKPFKLEKQLKDVLEENVDEKYYLSDKMIDYMKRTSSGGIQHGKGIRTLDDETCGTIMAEAQLKTGGGAALLRED